MQFARKSEIQTDDLFSVEELMEILSWDIADEIKIGLLKFTNEGISIIGKNYTPAVCMYILDNNFMEENLIELFSSFDEWNDSVQNIIFALSIKYITDIIDSPKDISENLKQKLIHSDNLSKDTKIELFTAMLPTLNEKLIINRMIGDGELIISAFLVTTPSLISYFKESTKQLVHKIFFIYYSLLLFFN